MSERDLTLIWFTAERERNISGAFALAVTDVAERTPTKRNIEPNVTPLHLYTVFPSIACHFAEQHILFKYPRRNASNRGHINQNQIDYEGIL